MKEILNESLTKYVYHFTTMNALDSIIEYNRIELSDARISNTDMACMPSGYPFYLSFTTQSNPFVGYVSAQNRKSETNNDDERDDERDDDFLDSDIVSTPSNGKYSKLQPKRIKDLGRFGVDADIRRRRYAKKYADVIDRRGVKPALKYKDESGNTIYVMDKNSARNRESISRFSETEQRLFSKERVMENVYDFIERIDIFPFINNLNVRICFNGEKISSQYKSGPVDFVYQKYKDALKRGVLANKQADTTSTLVGGTPKKKGRPSKVQQVNEASKSNNGFNINQLMQMLDWGKETKSNSKNKSLNWGSKIFVHTNNKNKSVIFGIDFIKKYANKLGIMNLGDYKSLDLRFKGLKSTIKRGVIEITQSVVNDICTIIFTLTPSFNGNQKEKITYCRNVFDEIFGNLKVYLGKNKEIEYFSKLLKLNTKLDSKFIKDWFSSKSKSSTKFNSTSAIIPRLSKSYKGALYEILVRIDKFIEDFANSNGINKNSVVYYQWVNDYSNNMPSNKTKTPKTKLKKTKDEKSNIYDEAEIVKMVNEVLSKIY